MDLDETWQVGLRPEKTKPRCGFRRQREKMGRRGVVFFFTWATHHFCHFPWIDFRQTSHEHVSRYGGSRHMVSTFTFQKIFHQGVEFPEKPYFRVLYGTLFVLSLRVTGNVLRQLHCFHPLVDIPHLSFLGDFRWGMYRFPAIHLRTSSFATIQSGPAKVKPTYFTHQNTQTRYYSTVLFYKKTGSYSIP